MRKVLYLLIFFATKQNDKAIANFKKALQLKEDQGIRHKLELLLNKKPRLRNL